MKIIIQKEGAWVATYLVVPDLAPALSLGVEAIDNLFKFSTIFFLLLRIHFLNCIRRYYFNMSEQIEPALIRNFSLKTSSDRIRT